MAAAVAVNAIATSATGALVVHLAQRTTVWLPAAAAATVLFLCAFDITQWTRFAPPNARLAFLRLLRSLSAADAER